MRAQLLTHALRASAVEVDVVTTSPEGVVFLAQFGIDATLLSTHYAVQFDACQNMLRVATDANVAGYLFRPSRMMRDVVRLSRMMRRADLIINDSFHPALLFMGWFPTTRRKVVHVYGDSLRHALETNFAGRWPRWLAMLFGRVVSWQIDASCARLEHDFPLPTTPMRGRNTYRLPTPVALVAATAKQGGGAAVYLNPHFRDPQLAHALERGFALAGIAATLTGEGYAQRPGWAAQDADWVSRAAASDLIVSAPGMAALAVALVYQRPILLVLTEQPEQRINAARAAELDLLHRTVVWRGDAEGFAAEVRDACRQLVASEPSRDRGDGHAAASARLQRWLAVIVALARQ